jgi:GH43 family beta-xylosidase
MTTDSLSTCLDRFRLLSFFPVVALLAAGCGATPDVEQPFDAGGGDDAPAYDGTAPSDSGRGDATGADGTTSLDANPADGTTGTDANHDDGATGGDAGPANMTFRNPLNTGPDPFMTYYGGNYYLSTTQGDALRMWKSPTIGGLLAAAPTVIWQDPDTTRNQQVWAPSFYLLNGHWYVYYTSDDGTDDHHRLRVLESDGTDPLGPYTFKATLNPPGADYWAIDPVLIPQTGGQYIAWSGAGTEGHNLIYVAPLSDPWTISGPRTYLAAAGGCPEVREAPSVVQHGGTTFLVYSTCDTGKPDYQLWALTIPTSADPTVASNWQQSPSALFARNDAAGVWGPGSNGFFKSPDGTEDWIVYHGKNTDQYTYGGRDTRAQPIHWNADGTPEFGAPVGVDVSQNVPSGDPGGGPYWINDTGTSSGPGTVTFDASWTAYSTCGVQCFQGDDHGSNKTGATATFSFTGTQIALLAARASGNGIGAFSLDGAPETTADYYLAIRQGEQLVYVSPRVPNGPHTLSVRVTGNKNSASADAYVSVDRAEVYAN